MTLYFLAFNYHDVKANVAFGVSWGLTSFSGALNCLTMLFVIDKLNDHFWEVLNSYEDIEASDGLKTQFTMDGNVA